MKGIVSTFGQKNAPEVNLAPQDPKNPTGLELLGKNVEATLKGVEKVNARQDSLDAEIAELRKGYEKLQAQPNDAVRKDEYAKLHATVEELVKKANTKGGLITLNQESMWGKAEDARTFMKAVKYASVTGQKAILDTTIATTGGYLTPVVWSNTLIDTTCAGGEILARANILPMTSMERRLPRALAYPQVGWVNEGAMKPVSAPVFGDIVQNPKDLAVIVVATDEFLEDNAINFEQWLTNAVRDAMIKEVERVAIVGSTAAGDPFNGIVNSTGIITVTLTGPADVIRLKYAVPKCHRANGVFMMNSATFVNFLELPSNTAPVWLATSMVSFVNGAPMLNNSPVIIDDDMEDGQIIFGDPQYLIISPRNNDMRVKYSQDAIVTDGSTTHNLYQEDKTGFRFNQRWAINPIGDMFAVGQLPAATNP